MVLQKRLDYGFNDYQAPATPRTIRSTRRRVNFQRRAEDNQMCAFDLLATLAGKLLQEKENTTMYSDTSSEKDQCGYVKEYQAANKSEDSCFKLDGDTTKVKDELHKFEKVPIGNGTEMCSFEDPLDENPPALISLGGNAKLSGCNDRNPCSSSAKGYDNVPVVNRDDDENSSGCTHPNTKTKSFRPKTCTYDNRIGNILASKFRKVAEKSKDDILSNSDLRQTYRIKKNCCKRQSSQMNIPFKKRKLYNCSSFSNSNRFISSGGIYYSPEHGMNQDASGSTRGMHKDLGISSSEASQPQTLQCRSSRVKRRIPIKSFRVPELFIEVPETATIGSLKRTVMDAVTAVLGDGLRIGVILQGKKVRDDSKTLLQTGISHDNQLDALGFTLEPNSSQSLPIACAAHFPSVPSADIPQPLIRYPSSPAVTRQRIQRNSDMLPEHEIAGFGNLVESDQDSAPSTINRFNTSVDKGRTDSKGLVIAPEMDKEELAMLTVHQKSKRSEIVQRRIRRPFSVDEVEALVHAVEKLGTGRWRDVKLLAFDNAKHRTYVDLKDKWKTLVHTARISPQQRRGEPVPQKLLDRVLTAHAYWSQQQDKPQHKQLPETAFFNKGLSPARGFVDGVGVLVSEFCY